MRCPTLNELPPPPPGKTGWPWTEESPQLPDDSPCPRVSIVTPSYNQARFIEETIRSVLLQGYPNLEYSIIDGGSTDDSVEIIRKYAPWLAYSVSEPDRGQSHAINRGWRGATGEILAWLNSDDMYGPEAVGQAAKFLLAHPMTDMVYGDCRMIDEHGKFMKWCPTMAFDLKVLLRSVWFIAQQATFIRRRVIDKVGELNEELDLVMDWELWLRIALAGFNIQYFQKELASFRKWTGAKTSSQSERSGQEKLKVLDALFSEPVLPSTLRTVRKRAYGHVHRFMGINYYTLHQMPQARHHLLKAVRMYPSCLRDGSTSKPLLLLLMGKNLTIWLTRWKSKFSFGSRR